MRRTSPVIWRTKRTALNSLSPIIYTVSHVQAIDVKFSQDLTHQKSLKSVNFWQSYLKNKKVHVFFGTQCSLESFTDKYVASQLSTVRQ